MSKADSSKNQSTNVEKRLRALVPVYLSVIFLLLVFTLVFVDVSTEIQQVLVAIIGLILVFTLDSFKEVLSDDHSPPSGDSNKIIIGSGGMYVAGSYYGGDINNTTGKKQTLAEAAVEIQTLLKTLEITNPNATEAEKVAYVNDEVSPEMKSRVASVVKETGESEAVSEIQNFIEANESSDKLLSAVDTSALKQRVIEAFKASTSSGAFGPIGSVLTAVIHTWSRSDD